LKFARACDPNNVANFKSSTLGASPGFGDRHLTTERLKVIDLMEALRGSLKGDREAAPRKTAGK
jgi:hypothetical protein